MREHLISTTLTRDKRLNDEKKWKECLSESLKNMKNL